MDLEQPDSRPQPAAEPVPAPAAPVPVPLPPPAVPPPAVPVPSAYVLPDCHRHPGRETGVRCTRCDRPVCPECRVDASVGFQCRDCVSGRGPVGEAQGSGGAGAGVPASGAVPAAARRQRVVQVRSASFAPVTKALIAANVLVFLLVQARGTNSADRWMMQGYAVAQQGEWYRMVSSMFLHQQIWHVGMNMWSLWVLGPMLESALGRVRYLALYLLSGLAGAALYLLLAPEFEASLGASGAVFGLLGALFVLFRHRRYQMGQLTAVLVVNLVATFAVSGIAWQDHVGGLVAGALTAWGFIYAPAARRVPVQVLTVVLVAVAVAVVGLVGAAQIGPV